MRGAMRPLALLLAGLALLLAPACPILADGETAGTALVNTFSQAPSIETTAENVLVVDRDSGQALYEKNAAARLYPASTTKLMTALCAVEMTEDLDGETVTVRQEVLDQLPDNKNSLAGLKAGEELTMRQLLYCLLLPSGNDAALVIANALADSESAFAWIMNQRAVELGCTDTYFVNAHGLAGQEQYTTAWDLARIAEAFLARPELVEIAGALEYTFSTNKREDVTVRSSDLLLDPESDLYEPTVVCGKTGTVSLGACYVSAAEKDGLRTLCVVAGVPPRDRYGNFATPNPALAEGRKFIRWANETFARVTLYDGRENIPVALEGTARYALAALDGPVTAVLPKAQAAAVTRRVEVAEGVQAPQPAGAEVGAVTWYCGEEPVGQGLPLVLVRGTSPLPPWAGTAMWTALVLLAALSVLWRFLHRRRRARWAAERVALVIQEHERDAAPPEDEE